MTLNEWLLDRRSNMIGVEKIDVQRLWWPGDSIIWRDPAGPSLIIIGTNVEMQQPLIDDYFSSRVVR